MRRRGLLARGPSVARALGMSLLLTAAGPAVAADASSEGASAAAGMSGTGMTPAEEGKRDLPSEIRKAMSQLQDAVALPSGKGMKAIKLGTRLFFVSGNGRLIIEGAAYDTWTGNAVSTMDQAKRMANFIAFDEMKVSLSDLDPLSFGNGGEQKRVVVATDPLCKECRMLLDRIKNRPQLVKDYQFEILLLPKSQESGPTVRRYFCADDEVKALKALFAGRAVRLENPDQSCMSKEIALRKRIATMYLLGLKKMPTVIAPNGRVHAGVPSDLTGFLEENLE